MKTAKRVVAAWFILFVVSGLALEAWLVATGSPTISRVVWEVQKAYPPTGFLVGLPVGVLLGHLFWSNVKG